jgi:tetratricopeptide (TPR) repeat protein
VARALARARLQQFAPARADLEAALARDPRQPEVARLAKLLALTDRKVEPEAAASADDEEAAEHDSLALVLAALRAERANEVAEVANLMDRLQTLSRQSPTPEAGPTRIEGGHGDHWRTTADWLSALRKPLGESTVAGATLALSRLTLRDQRAAAEQVAAVKDPAKPVAWLARLRADVATRLGRTEDAIRHRKRWQELGGDSASAGQPATIPVVDREPEPTRRPTPSSPTDGGSEPSIARRAAREAHRLGEWTKAATLWRRALPTLSSEELTLAGQAAALADGNGSPDLANLVAECAAGPLTRPQATNAAPIDLERRLRAISYTGVSTTIPIPPAVAGDRESALSVALLESIGANPQAALVRLEELPSRAGERTAVERAIRVIALARTGDLEKAAREHRRLEVVRETLAADPTAEDEPGFQDDERRGLFELAKRLGARTDDSTTRERRNY